WKSFGFVLSWELAEGLFGVLDILCRKFAGFDQPCDHVFHPTAEQAEEIVNQSVFGYASRDYGFEDIGIANLLDDSDSVFAFEPVHDGLDGRVRRTLFLGKRILNFPNGTRPPSPQGIHDLQFEFGQFRSRYFQSTYVSHQLTTYIGAFQSFSSIEGVLHILAKDRWHDAEKDTRRLPRHAAVKSAEAGKSPLNTPRAPACASASGR